MTQRDVYNALGMSSTVYNRYENGNRVPPLETLVAFADLYGVSLDYLVGRTDDPNGGYQPPVDGQEAQQ